MGVILGSILILGINFMISRGLNIRSDKLSLKTFREHPYRTLLIHFIKIDLEVIVILASLFLLKLRLSNFYCFIIIALAFSAYHIHLLPKTDSLKIAFIYIINVFFFILINLNFFEYTQNIFYFLLYHYILSILFQWIYLDIEKKG